MPVKRKRPGMGMTAATSTTAASAASGGAPRAGGGMPMPASPANTTGARLQQKTKKGTVLIDMPPQKPQNAARKTAKRVKS